MPIEVVQGGIWEVGWLEYGKCEEIESGEKLALYVTTTVNFEWKWRLSLRMTIITV